MALVIRHATRKGHIILSSLTCLAVPYPSTLFINGTIFAGTLLNMKCLFWFCVQSLKHFSFLEEFSETPSWIHINFHVKCPLFLSDFRQISKFSTDFREIYKFKISWKSFQWGAQLLYAEELTDRYDAANGRFFFAALRIVPKNWNHHNFYCWLQRTCSERSTVHVIRHSLFQMLWAIVFHILE